ncbi:MAG: hypothetical protein ACRCVT_09870 [Leadbetterella sp.]
MLATNALVFVGLYAFLEVLSIIYLTFVDKSAKRPSHIIMYDNPNWAPHLINSQVFWADVADSVGRWRISNAERNDINCETSERFVYRTNNAGLRDIDRNLVNENNVVFLGDSFVEGFMVDEKKRFSNVLESKTNIPHINLAVSGANPTAYYLIYEKMAKRMYPHDKVMVGVCLGNDFDSFDQPVNDDFIDLPIYRAYWSKKGDLKYTLADISHSSSSLVYPDSKYIRYVRDSIYNAQNLGRKLLLEYQTNSYLYSVLKSFGKKIATVRYEKHYKGYLEKPCWGMNTAYEFLRSFDEMIREVHPKPLLIVILPTLKDVINYRKNKADNFTGYLQKRYPMASFINLTPYLSQFSDPQKFYIACDGHLNNLGHKTVANYILCSNTYKNFISRKGL